MNKLFQVRKQKIPLDTFMNLRSAMYQRGFTYGYQKHSPAEIVRKFRTFKNQKLFCTRLTLIQSISAVPMTICWSIFATI